MTAKLTDEAVAALELSHGRAELLEEIMRTPVLDDRPVRPTLDDPGRRRAGWLLPAVAAALVAVLALGTAWWATERPAGAPGGVAAEPIAGAAGDRVVLDATGWTLAAVHDGDGYGEMNYVSSGQTLEISWGAAEDYDSFVADRRRIVSPPADGAPVEILGRDAQMWAYGPSDHTAIREVQGGTWIEFRGDGMGEAAYLSLLGQLRLVDEDEFESLLPAPFVSRGENAAAVDGVLDGIEAAAGTLLPPGVARASIASAQTDDYHLGAELAGAVACAWLDEYADARLAGDTDRAQRAVDVLATSRDWPVLQQIDARGYYPEVLWSYADKVAAGEVPDGYPGGLGCD